MRWCAALLLATVTVWGQEPTRLEITTQNKMSQTLELKELSYTLDGRQVVHLAGADPQLKNDLLGSWQEQPSAGPHKLSATLTYQGRRMGVFSYMTGYKFKIDVNFEVQVEPAHRTVVTLVGYLKPGSISFEQRPTAGFFVSYDPPLVDARPVPPQTTTTTPEPLDASVAPPSPPEMQKPEAQKPEAQKPKEQLAIAEKPSKPEKPPRAEKPPKPEKPEKPEKPLRAEKPPKPEKPEKPLRAEKPPKPEKPEKPLRAEKPPRVAELPPSAQEAPGEKVHTQLFNPSGITSHIVHFDFDADRPHDRFLRVLDGIARSLVQHPEIRRLRIEGHTDEIGDESYNQGLSERRARWVANYLSEKNVAAERLNSVGFGEGRPRAEGHSSVARAQNRRIEFVIEE